MFNLKKLLFGGTVAPGDFPPDVQAALASWRSLAAPALTEPHFHVRYVAVDLAVTGTGEEETLQGVAAAGLKRGGVMVPQDMIAFDAAPDVGVLDRQLAALLGFTAKSPLVTYRVPFVEGILHRVFGERLGVNFRPTWIDLAWLLPELFPEIATKPVAREVWLDAFAIDTPEGRDAPSRLIPVAKLLQVALARAGECGIDTPVRLAEAAQARRFLRQSA